MPAMTGVRPMNSDTMNGQLSAVMQRRGELLDRIASQRVQMAEIGARLQAPLSLADRGIAVVRFLRSNPVLVTGVIAFLVVRRRSAVAAVGVIWRVWKAYRSFTTIKAGPQ